MRNVSAMIVLLILIGAVAVVAIVATLRTVAVDGLRRVPDRGFRETLVPGLSIGAQVVITHSDTDGRFWIAPRLVGNLARRLSPTRVERGREGRRCGRRHDVSSRVRYDALGDADAFSRASRS